MIIGGCGVALLGDDGSLSVKRCANPRALRDALVFEQVEAACADCGFSSKPAALTDPVTELKHAQEAPAPTTAPSPAVQEAPETIQPTDAAERAAARSSAVLDMPKQPPVNYAGYVPVNTHPGELESMVTDAEVERQPAPPVPGVITVEEIPAVGQLVTFEDLVLNKQPEPKDSVETLLTTALPWFAAGGSTMGWSKLKTAKLCLRMFFYEYVLGLKLKPREWIKRDEENEKPERINALELGTLVHACVEYFYRTGKLDMAPAQAVAAQYPALAIEAKRLTNFYLRRYNADEVKHWDMRATERESRFYFPARRCAGKRRRLLMSARHDHIYRRMQSGEKRLPPGAPATDVHVHELKSTAYLTGSRLRGFFQNAQLAMGLLTYNHGHAIDADGNTLVESNARLFGPTWIVTVTWIGKTKKQDLTKDIDRVDYPIPEPRVLHFADDLRDWYYDEIGERLFHAKWLEAMTWRKDWLCADMYYQGWTCPFLSLCEAGDGREHVNYDIAYDARVSDVEREAWRERLEMPKKLEKAMKKGEGKTVAAVEAK